MHNLKLTSKVNYVLYSKCTILKTTIEYIFEYIKIVFLHSTFYGDL